ncbi:MAG: bifunctional riboflavin kinase/FAD synthetase [Anaerolineaceae bacterium]|nr:bifunctional riboflavin kinase/FAD synthetase [Anaerolineaceae bacterium]
MQPFTALEQVSLQASWVTIGMYDGVHCGHRTILQPMAAEAHQNGIQAVVITFYPHPAVILRGLDTPFYLTSPQEKAALMKEMGINQVITLPFTRALADQTAEDFITQLVKHLGMRQLWAGSDFALGRNRAGNIQKLEQLGAALGFQVHVVAPINIDGKKISSSQIRRKILEGKVEEAADLLGRLYDIPGIVIHGDGRGASIGFPTANLEIWPQRLLPRNGVYATWVCRGGHRHPALINIGVRPTFENIPPQPRLEAYLLNFSGDLYGEHLRVEFLKFIRPEKRFDSIAQLKKQINKDIRFAGEVFQHAA